MKVGRHNAVKTVTIISVSISFTFVALRMVSRIFITRHTSWDDYMIVLAWIISFGGAIAILISTEIGIGLLDADIKPEWIEPLKKTGYAYTILYNPALMACKTSILIFYLHFAKTKKFLRLGAYGTLAVVNVGGIILTFLNIFQCSPLSKTFSQDSFDTSLHCIPIVTLFLSSSPVNILSDLSILVLPIPVLTGMHLPRRQKNVVVVLFCLGIFVTVVDIIRIYYLQKALTFVEINNATPRLVHGLGNAPNFVYAISFSLMWSVVEVNTGIVCACIPLLKPLVVKVVPKLADPIGRHAVDGAHTEPDIAAQTRLDRMLTRPQVQDNIEGFTPLNFRMPTSPIPEMTMSPTQLGSPLLQDSQQRSASSVQGMQTPPRQPSPQILPSPIQGPRTPAQRLPHQTSLSPVQENATSLHEHSLEASPPPVPGDGIPIQGSSRPAASLQHQDVDALAFQPAQVAEGTTLTQEQREQQQHELDMMPDFVTTPGMNNPTQGGSALNQTNNVNFGFINIRAPQSMKEISARDAWKLCAWVSTVFALWGFSYGLINSVNIQISLIANYTQSITLSLHTMYFGAYFLGPLTVGLYCLHKAGCKATIIVGLCIYGTGTLVFWPSSILIVYPGFVVSHLIIGFGLSIIEMASSLFVISCGPRRYLESRLLAAQSVQAIWSIVSQLIVEKGFFPAGTTHDNLLSIRWTYLAISFITVIIALCFYYLPLPEARDDDLHDVTQTRFLPLNRATNNNSRIFRWRVTVVNLALACICQFFYVFVQESFNIWFYNSLISRVGDGDNSHRQKTSSPTFVIIGHATFALSRILSAVLCLYVRPRIILLLSFVGSAAVRLAFTLMPSAVESGSTNRVSALAIIEYFMEGPIYGLVFALALRGLGSRAKLGAALITAMNIGGGVGPWVALALVKEMMHNRRPFTVGVILLFLAAAYPLYLSFVRKARIVADGNDDEGEETTRRRSEPSSVTEVEVVDGGVSEGANGTHWVGLVEKKWDRIRRASSTSGKAVGGWVVSVREWVRRVSGLEKAVTERETHNVSGSI